MANEIAAALASIPAAAVEGISGPADGVGEAARGRAAETQPGPGVAVPVDPDAVAEIRDAARRGPGRPRKDADPNAPKRSHHKKVGAREEPAPKPAVPLVDLKALEKSLTDAIELLVTLCAFAKVTFTDDERPVVGQCAIYCAETYLPGDASKHLPAAALVMVCAQAAMRARAEKSAAQRAAREAPDA